MIMSYEVIKEFIDRDTLENVGVGEKFACADSHRVKFLIERGYIKEADEPKTATAEKPAKKPVKRSTKKKA